MLDAAARGANYLESLETRPVFPREADIERLREALRGKAAYLAEAIEGA